MQVVSIFATASLLKYNIHFILTTYLFKKDEFKVNYFIRLFTTCQYLEREEVFLQTAKAGIGILNRLSTDSTLYLCLLSIIYELKGK